MKKHVMKSHLSLCVEPPMLHNFPQCSQFLPAEKLNITRNPVPIRLHFQQPAATRGASTLDAEGKLDANVNVASELDNLGELDSLLGGVLEIVNGEDLEARLVDDLVSLLVVGTLETGNDGDLEVEGLDGLDQAGSNVVATDDTTEDVDEDGSDLGVAGNELKGLLDGGGGSTTTNVEEVGGLATVELDDIHGSHGKTGTVDEAANVTIELDEV